MTGSSQHEVQELRRRFRRCGEMIVESISVANKELDKTLRDCLRSIEDAYGSQWKLMMENVLSLQPAAERKLSLTRSIEYAERSTLTQNRTTSQKGSGRRLWWVNQRSLEQATCVQVARVKAKWFGDHTVHDLCSGIGGDAVPLSERGIVHVVERDPMLAAMVAENLYLAETSHSYHVHCCELLDHPMSQHSWIHIDPDRRIGKRTARDPSSFSPNWEDVCDLVSRCDGAVVKLAPASEVPQDQDTGIDESDFHRLWFEYKGTVREQDLLWGGVCQQAGLERGERSASVIRGDGSVATFCAKHDQHRLVESETQFAALSGGHLIDPKSAIRAAGLTGAFAERNQLKFLAGPSGFLFAPELAVENHDLAAMGCVSWVGSCDDRKLRKELRNRNCYPETIKVRGTDHDPALLVKRYRNCGEHPIRLWIGRIGKRVFAAMTETANANARV